MNRTRRYCDFNSWLREKFGERVQKISVDAGLTCPNRDGTISTGGCIYCNASGSGTGAHAQGRRIREQVIQGAEFVSRRYKAGKFLVYFQSFSNTYAPVEVLRRLYDEALTAVDGVVGLSIGTRPDCVDEPVLELLQGYAEDYLIWIEYGLQSACDRTLALINRGHDFDCFRQAVAMTRNRGIQICAHVILGLPGETRGEMRETAHRLADLGVEGVKLHLLYVVRGTALEEMYRRGDYVPLEPQEYADRVAEFLACLPPDMVVQRITGDPHREELVAPAWALEKGRNRQMILETLEKRDIWQGKNYRKKS